MGHMVGETTTYDAIVEAAERITGRTFLRKYVGRSELEELAKDPSKKFYYQVSFVVKSFILIVQVNDWIWFAHDALCRFELP